MELQQIILTSLLSILLVVLSVVGIQIFLLLGEFRKTLHKANGVIESAESKFNALVQPLHNLSNAAVGFQTGMKAIEAVMEWVNEKKQASAIPLEEIDDSGEGAPPKEKLKTKAQ